jgi:molecular chaperone GrpE (heat shock protein)
MSDPGPNHADAQQPSDKEEALARAVQILKREYHSFLLEFIVFLDGLLRWQEALEGAQAEHNDVLVRQATGILLQHGIRPTARVGQALDLNYHEVMATEHDVDAPPDTIVQVVEMGYEMVHHEFGRFTFRTARVVVSAAAEQTAPAQESNDQEAR